MMEGALVLQAAAHRIMFVVIAKVPNWGTERNL